VFVSGSQGTCWQPCRQGWTNPEGWPHSVHQWT